ncbi:MAG: hypothetical protein ACI96P_001979 [Candidatus Azotimanducaceae bacterium]
MQLKSAKPVCCLRQRTPPPECCFAAKLKTAIATPVFCLDNISALAFGANPNDQIDEVSQPDKVGAIINSPLNRLDDKI